MAWRRKSWPTPCGVWSKYPLESAGIGASPGLRRLLEQEELDLGVGVEGEAELRRPRQRALQHVARVGPAGRSVGHQDVAEHARGAGRFRPPRQDLERRRVRLGEHVGFVDPGEPLDRRAVEADALGEGALEFGGCHRDRLQEAEHVGEPQPHEADVTLFERAQYKLGLLVHAAILSAPRYVVVTPRRR